jgi:hypothetical protein
MVYTQFLNEETGETTNKTLIDYLRDELIVGKE